MGKGLKKVNAKVHQVTIKQGSKPVGSFNLPNVPISNGRGGVKRGSKIKE